MDSNALSNHFRFEKQLREKIMNKNTKNINEASFLQKQLKYFDI